MNRANKGDWQINSYNYFQKCVSLSCIWRSWKFFLIFVNVNIAEIKWVSLGVLKYCRKQSCQYLVTQYFVQKLKCCPKSRDYFCKMLQIKRNEIFLFLYFSDVSKSHTYIKKEMINNLWSTMFLFISVHDIVNEASPYGIPRWYIVSYLTLKLTDDLRRINAVYTRIFKLIDIVR